MKFLKLMIVSFFINVAFANPQSLANPSYEMPTNLNVKNTILAKVQDKTITVYDVIQKMDSTFQKSFPDLIDSFQSRMQFYVTGWRQTLEDLINLQLIILDASKKELKVTDAEVREEIENRYGPNIMINLKKNNLSYEDALKVTKEDMIMQRMMWYFVRNKADQKITPSAIRNAYRLFCLENPNKDIYKYHVISITANNEKEQIDLSEKISKLLKEENKDPLDYKQDFEKLENLYKDSKITVSNLFEVSSKEISASHKTALQNLEKFSYSDIFTQTSRYNNKKVSRIFYLKEKEIKLTEPFNQMANKLKEELTQKALNEEANKYFEKLKKDYSIEKNPQVASKEYMPFSFN
ncbi:MAG: SurA N-terminal domain-containing protein [Parachlamydiales bacterium]|nr:SurA N-terminal domain-containing protein [Parachlamydiales bacterium]